MAQRNCVSDVEWAERAREAKDKIARQNAQLAYKKLRIEVWDAKIEALQKENKISEEKLRQQQLKLEETLKKKRELEAEVCKKYDDWLDIVEEFIQEEMASNSNQYA